MAFEKVQRALFNAPAAHGSLFEDQVLTFDTWAKRRSWLRHSPEPGVCVRVAAGFTLPLFYVLALSCLVGVYEDVVRDRRDWPSVRRLNIIAAVNVVVFAVPLLLVFRTNSCYGRWWEGRIIWGLVVNVTRNLARQAVAHMQPKDASLAAAILRWTAAAPRALKAHVRQGVELRLELQEQGLLSAAEVDWVLASANGPVSIGLVLATLVARADLPPQMRALMDEQITGYVNAAGACERILKTGIPVAYTRHTSRFLMIYASALPFMLWQHMGWASAPAATLIAFLLLGVENIGVQIEEPFHVLPLEAICLAVERNIEEMQQRQGSAAALLFGDGGLRSEDAAGVGLAAACALGCGTVCGHQNGHAALGRVEQGGQARSAENAALPADDGHAGLGGSGEGTGGGEDRGRLAGLQPVSVLGPSTTLGGRGSAAAETRVPLRTAAVDACPPAAYQGGGSLQEPPPPPRYVAVAAAPPRHLVAECGPVSAGSVDRSAHGGCVRGNPSASLSWPVSASRAGFGSVSDCGGLGVEGVNPGGGYLR